tara:strand:+ start:56 stop:400 length:345 start_codon:yes stop_codon:yes gene_type:complete
MTKLKETDLQDSQGNIVISPDLKVRHKKSQYEYTVDSVIQDESGENIVLLRLPEEPRIEPIESKESLIIDLTESDVIYEVDPSVAIYEPEDDDLQDEDLLAVPQEEFEKEYEVK